MTFDQWLHTTMLPAEVDDERVQVALRICWQYARASAFSQADHIATQMPLNDSELCGFTAYTIAAAIRQAGGMK